MKLAVHLLRTLSDRSCPRFSVNCDYQRTAEQTDCSVCLSAPLAGIFMPCFDEVAKAFYSFIPLHPHPPTDSYLHILHIKPSTLRPR